MMSVYASPPSPHEWQFQTLISVLIEHDGVLSPCIGQLTIWLVRYGLYDTP